MKIQRVVTLAFCSLSLRTFSLASFDSPVSYHNDASWERAFGGTNADWICHHPCNVLIKAPQKSELCWGKLVHLLQDTTRYDKMQEEDQFSTQILQIKVSRKMQSFTAWTWPTNFHFSWSSKANGSQWFKSWFGTVKQSSFEHSCFTIEYGATSFLRPHITFPDFVLEEVRQKTRQPLLGKAKESFSGWSLPPQHYIYSYVYIYIYSRIHICMYIYI